MSSFFQKGWWSILTIFNLKKFENQLMKIGLYRAIRAIQYGIPFSRFHFFSILKLYNSKAGTFFTPISKMGLALHEPYKVSGLPMGEAPYEEYVMTREGLNLL